MILKCRSSDPIFQENPIPRKSYQQIRDGIKLIVESLGLTPNDEPLKARLSKIIDKLDLPVYYSKRLLKEEKNLFLTKLTVKSSLNLYPSDVGDPLQIPINICPGDPVQIKPCPIESLALADQPLQGYHKMILIDKTFFTCHFVNGLLNNKGKGLYPGGVRYEGTFKDGKRDGEGTCDYGRDSGIYSGEWLNDKRHGKGNMEWTDKSSYKGDWENDSEHGHGEMRYHNGDTYVGNFKNGLRSGLGVFNYHLQRGKTHIIRYNGFWHQDQQHGIGEITWTDGCVQVRNYLNGKVSKKRKSCAEI